MRCETARESLIALIDGELSGLAVWSVRRHATRCGECNRELVLLQGLNDRLKSLDVLSTHSPAIRRLSVAATAPTVVSKSRRRELVPGGWEGRPQRGRAWMSRGFLPAAAALGALTLIALAVGRWASEPTTRLHPSLLVQRSRASTLLSPMPPAPPPRVASGRVDAAPMNSFSSGRSEPDRRSANRERAHRGQTTSHQRSTPAPGVALQLPAPGDLAALNLDPGQAARRWASLPADRWKLSAARAHHGVRVRDDFVQIPLPRLVDTSYRQVAAAVEAYKREAAIVDPRLSREITLASKATALADLCDHLRQETIIRIEAGSSVTDEKVTIFCEKMPLRDVMRQLSRPFGYAWLRSGKAGEYRYELVQDLRSQLMEEELRNRDRNEALLALDREMQRYRPFLGLSPDEALERAKTASPGDKKLLEQIAGKGWGPIQVYFRLSPSELAALRAGQSLVFAQEPKPGEQPLPAGLERGVLGCLRDVFLIPRDGGYDFPSDKTDPRRLPLLTAVPEAQAQVKLSLSQSELGRFTLDGSSRFTTGNGPNGLGGGFSDGPVAVGVSHAASERDNRSVNAWLAHDPAFRSRVTLQPKPSCRPAPHPDVGEKVPEPKVTSADLLEALHRATGMPIIADYYTRLYRPDAISMRNSPLFEALSQVTDTMGLRWNKDGAWLQFRSATYYDDRLKEVPNRLLAHWAEARRRQGTLTLDNLIEIAQLSDAQLDAAAMAEGARECFGLREWDLARHRSVRPDWRFLAQLTPVQRQEAQRRDGLSFTKLSLPQQQQFIALAAPPREKEPVTLEEIARATLSLAYTQPGAYEWRPPGPPAWHSLAPSAAQAPTREAALLAARRLDPQVQADKIVPTELAVSMLYRCGSQPRAQLRVLRITRQGRTAYDGRPRDDRTGG
jgi:hypothetical protein